MSDRSFKIFVILFVATLSAAALYISHDVSAQDTAGTAQPGTRCTRFRDKKPKAGETGPGTRCARMYAKHKRGKIFPNQPPTVSITASPFNSALPVNLRATATDTDGDTLLYTYSVTGGRISGDGPNVQLDLTGVMSGTYTATVEVDDGCGCISFSSATITVPQ